MLDAYIVDRTGVAGIGLGVERGAERFEAGRARPVQCQDRSAILHQRLEAGLVGDITEH